MLASLHLADKQPTSVGLSVRGPKHPWRAGVNLQRYHPVINLNRTQGSLSQSTPAQAPRSTPVDP